MILAALLLAAFLVNLDTTLVNVALPTLVRQLHATTTQLQWVVDSFNLVFAALLLTFGSLSDRFGRKGMLLAGLTVFGAASLAGGSVGAAYTAAGQLAALGHPALGLALQHASANAFLRGLTIGALVAGGVAAAGAILAILFLPAQPASRPAEESAEKAPESEMLDA